jgi:hypothetical protein
MFRLGRKPMGLTGIHFFLLCGLSVVASFVITPQFKPRRPAALSYTGQHRQSILKLSSSRITLSPGLELGISSVLKSQMSENPVWSSNFEIPCEILSLSLSTSFVSCQPQAWMRYPALGFQTMQKRMSED